MHAHTLRRIAPIPTREIRLTAYDDREQEYELVCTVAYGETAGGKLMVVDAKLTFDREDAAVDAKLRQVLERALAIKQRIGSEASFRTQEV